MKYIKTFESNYPKFYLIRTDSPYLEISLKKIGVDNYEILSLSNNSAIRSLKKIYKTTEPYGWMQGDDDGKTYYINRDYSYSGEIIVTPEEVKKYELEKAINNYNL